MRKIWLWTVLVSLCASLPMTVAADGVNIGLADAPVTPVLRSTGAPLSATRQVVIPGSNQVGRPGVAPDQFGGYEVNIAYDHVVVGIAIVGVLFVMTEWVEAR